MRKGKNNSKDILIETDECFHRVIIPLYIPYEEDYYKESYKVFEYCVFSLLKTSLTKLKISVISNNSCDSVNEKILDLYKKGHIDEFIIEKEAIGKINSVLKALRTAEERLITITDADVLFCNGWEKAVLDVFNSFPKAGAVCPVPVFRKHLHLTTNIWFKYFFSDKLYFRAVKNPEALTRFANSIGWSRLDLKFKDLIGTLKAKNGTVAVLGCSHFVATYKKEVFEKSPKISSKYKLGGDSEYLYTDEPVLKKNGYRLSTYDNYAYHMGNVIEPWMEEFYSKIQEEKKILANEYSKIPELKTAIIPWFFYEKVFKKIFYFKKIYRLILRHKGLSVEQSNFFVS